MLKVLNISTLILFLCFLFAPTISYAIDKDLIKENIVLTEEEESHSKSKKGNNNLSEEEENEVHYSLLSQFRNIISKSGLNNFYLAMNDFSIEDDLVFKIPLPPPENQL